MKNASKRLCKGCRFAVLEGGDYDWFDIELNGAQVGTFRCRIEGLKLTVFSIMIYPEYEKHGFARSVIVFFQEPVSDPVRQPRTVYCPGFLEKARVRRTGRNALCLAAGIANANDRFYASYDQGVPP